MPHRRWSPPDCESANAGEACDAGFVCSAGSCALSCQVGLVECNGTCIDPLSSNTFCGASADCQDANEGEVCEAGSVCSAGSCALSCQAGLVDCSGTCIDPLTHGAYCGASGSCVGPDAGEDCDPGFVCSAGSCALSCQVGLVECAGACIDPLTSPVHCGASGSCQGPEAGVVCASGACSAGECLVVCGQGQTHCSDQCVDVTTHPLHCGGCDVACDSGEVCDAGDCVAQPCDWDPAELDVGVGGTFTGGFSALDPTSCDIWGTISTTNAVFRLTFPTGDLASVNNGPPAAFTKGLAYAPAFGAVLGLQYQSSTTSLAVLHASAPPTALPVSNLQGFPNGLAIAPPAWGAFGGHAVAVSIEGAVQVVDPSGGAASVLTTMGGVISGVVFDGATLYVAVQGSNTVFAVSPTGVATPVVTLTCVPGGLEIDPGVRLFVACGNNQIFSFGLPAGPLTLLGTPNFSGGWDPQWLEFDGVNSLIFPVEPTSFFQTIEL